MEYLNQNETSINPFGLLFLACMLILTWTLPRRSAVFPLLITTSYMPLGQMFVIGGLHIQFFRVVLLAGWCRVLARKESVGGRFNSFDRLFLCWAAASLVMGTLAEPTMDRFINRSGEAINALAAFFLIRCWLKTLEDVIHVVRFLAVLVVPLAISMLMEKATGRNFFAVLGGVPEVTAVREGKLRCQGAFRHPILAGTYGATVFPLFVGLWFQGVRERRRAIAGAAAAVIVTVAAASSGALLALMGEVTGLLLWRMRFSMRLVRRGMLLTLLLLALVMNAPVWYIFARASEVVGGTGWYRSYLIEQAVNHFDEWWLVGSTYTAHWAPGGQVLANDPNNTDIVNNYVAEALGGGVLKLGLFVAMIVIGFKTVGKWIRKKGGLSREQRLFIWSLGVCLLGHCLSFMSVSYFDQIVVMWYWLLAVVAALISNYRYTAQRNPSSGRTSGTAPGDLNQVHGAAATGVGG